MAGNERFKNGREVTIVDIQPGGEGNSWRVLDVDAEMTAPSGGGQGGESIWGRTQDGRGAQFLGTRRTGNPARYTGQMMLPLTAVNFLQSQRDFDCENNLRWRYKCDDMRVLTNYTHIENYFSSVLDSETYDNNMIDATEGASADIKQQKNFTAGLKERQVKVKHLDVSSTHSDFALNKVRQLSGARCAGPCGNIQTGEEAWGAVSDKDSTSGYASNPTAKFGWTLDKGATWTWSYVNVYQGVDASDFISYGDYVVVFSASRAPAYALWQDLIEQKSNAWTLASGISANFPSVAEQTPNGVIFAAGAGGYIYKSTTGGLSFTSVDAASATTENINSIAFPSDDFGWFAANNGVLLNYVGGVLSTVVVQDDTIGTTVVTDNLNVVRVPPNRANEVYVGTAGGDIWRSRAVNVQVPVFTIGVFGDDGEGSIDDIQFIGGAKGAIMYVVQTNGDGLSRVLRDNSGGALGNDVELVGGYTSPNNFGINSLAAANVNFAMTVGEVHTLYAFIGQITGV